MGTKTAHFPPLPSGEGRGEGELRTIPVSQAFNVAQPPSAVFRRRRKSLHKKLFENVWPSQFSLTPTRFAGSRRSARFSRRERGKKAASFALGILVLVAFCPGCTSSHPTASIVQSPVYAVPAQQLVVEVQK